jgi:hypothetical protein
MDTPYMDTPYMDTPYMDTPYIVGRAMALPLSFPGSLKRR